LPLTKDPKFPISIPGYVIGEKPRFALESLPTKDKEILYEEISRYINPGSKPQLFDVTVHLVTGGGNVLQSWKYQNCAVNNYATFFNYHTVPARVALGIWLLVWWTGAWSAFTRYFLNAWILTNQRIVDIKQNGYFNREVSSLFLSRVQDVTTNVTGVLSSLFGIGDINVQSAGAVEKFIMRGIPRPEQLRDIILRYVPAEPKNTGI